MDTEFINAYIQRMLALNSDLTNRNVMLETKLVLLETKHNALVQAYNTIVESQQPVEDLQTDTPTSKKQEDDEKSF